MALETKNSLHIRKWELSDINTVAKKRVYKKFPHCKNSSVTNISFNDQNNLVRSFTSTFQWSDDIYGLDMLQDDSFSTITSDNCSKETFRKNVQGFIKLLLTATE